MNWKISLAYKTHEMLLKIKDRRILEKIKERIDSLEHSPDQQGKPLLGDLAHYRSLRAVGQRYRIIYRVSQTLKTVTVIAVGIRKESDKSDIYALAKKLVKLGLV